MVEGKPRVVVGTQAAGAQVLAGGGGQTNPAVVARRKLRLRQGGGEVVALRHTVSACGGRAPAMADCARAITMLSCPPRVRQVSAEPRPTTGSGAAKGWWPCPPAMAAG